MQSSNATTGPAPLAPKGEPLDLTPEELDQCLAADDPTPVLLDLWAPWCQPCLAQAPTLRRFGHESSGKVRVVKVDVEKHSAATARFAARGIPTLILFQGGKEISRRTGVQTREQLLEWVQAASNVSGLGEGAEALPELDGAFYGDASLREFLVSRLVQFAKDGRIENPRFPFWAEGKGSVGRALVQHDEPSVFARVSGLPSSFGHVLHFAGVKEASDVAEVFERVPAGADVRFMAVRLVTAWLADETLPWREILGQEVDALRSAWLELVRTQEQDASTAKANWDALRLRADGFASDDPYKSHCDQFSKLINKLSPPPDGDEDRIWGNALLMSGTFFNLHFALYELGWREQDFAMEGIRHRWFSTHAPKDTQALSREEILGWRRRYEAENAELEAAFAPKEKLMFEHLTETMRSFHKRLQEQLLSVLSPSVSS